MTQPGLQVERTSLAWTRTSASAGALGILMLKLGIGHHNVAEIVAAACCLAGAVLMGMRHKHLRVARPRIAPTLIRITALIVAMLAAASVVCVITV